jgi:hypothetical protein
MNTKRGLFYAFLCAIVVGGAAFALVTASFARPGFFQSLLFGRGGFGLSLAGGDSGGSNADVVAHANPGVVTVAATRAIEAEESVSHESPRDRERRPDPRKTP